MIHLGKQDCIYLGNLNAERDWGHARDYVEGMWLMLQQDKPDDFVLATNEKHSVRQYVEEAFAVIDVKIKWEGENENEIGRDAATGEVRVRVDPQYYRPAEVELLIGNPAKAKAKLGWSHKMSFKDLVREMVESDVELVKTGRLHM